MKVYNVYFMHMKYLTKETIKLVKANNRIEARVNARNMAGYLDPLAYKIIKVEEIAGEIK